MKRLIVVIGSAALLLIGAFAGTAWARGDGWEPLPASPFDWQCGDTTVHIAYAMNKEYVKVTVLEDGTQVLKVTGALKLDLTTDAGASLEVNASGPGNSLAFPDGDFDFIGQGLNFVALTPEQSAATGLPEIFSAAGPIDILFRADGTVEVNRVNHKVTDICAELT
jgi:hypothetical protein